MQPLSPLFDKTLRARLMGKLEELIALAGTLQVDGDQTDHDALRRAVERLFRRTGMVLGLHGLGLEAQRLDQLLDARRPSVILSRDGRHVDAVVDLVQLIEDVLFLLSDPIARPAPLMPAPPAPAEPRPAARPVQAKRSKKTARKR